MVITTSPDAGVALDSTAVEIAVSRTSINKVKHLIEDPFIPACLVPAVSDKPAYGRFVRNCILLECLKISRTTLFPTNIVEMISESAKHSSQHRLRICKASDIRHTPVLEA